MALSNMGALSSIEPIIGKGGIHDHRAGIIRCALVGEVDGGNEITETSPDIYGKKDAMAEF